MSIVATPVPHMRLTDDLFLRPALAWVQSVRRSRECPDAYHTHVILSNGDIVQHHTIEVVLCQNVALEVL